MKQSRNSEAGVVTVCARQGRLSIPQENFWEILQILTGISAQIPVTRHSFNKVSQGQ